MSTEQQGDSAQQEPQSFIGNARFRNGKWFCECHIAARYLTATKSNIHRGKKFWRCANVDVRQCSFFLWVVHEAAAKEWLNVSLPNSKFQSPTKLPQRSNHTGPLLQTPKKTVCNGQDGSEIETPFTKAKKRRKSPPHVVDCNGNGSSESPFQITTAPESSNKAIKTSMLTTPTQRFAEKLKIGRSPLPASDFELIATNRSRKQTARELGAPLIFSPTKNTANPVFEGESGLTSTIIGLVRSDNVELKPSTEIQMRHEIDLVVDVGKAKVQRYEGTICKLHERVDELERMILHLTE